VPSRHCLRDAEFDSAVVDRFVAKTIDRVSELDLLKRTAPGREVAAVIRVGLHDVPGFTPDMNGNDWTAPKSTGGRWDLKELSNRMGNSAPLRRGTIRPRTPLERRAPGNMDLRKRSRLRVPGYATVADAHDHSIDRDTLDKLLRNLGRGNSDFGPEPPTGGQPARI